MKQKLGYFETKITNFNCEKQNIPTHEWEYLCGKTKTYRSVVYTYHTDKSDNSIL